MRGFLQFVHVFSILETNMVSLNCKEVNSFKKVLGESKEAEGTVPDERRVPSAGEKDRNGKERECGRWKRRGK